MGIAGIRDLLFQRQQGQATLRLQQPARRGERTRERPAYWKAASSRGDAIRFFQQPYGNGVEVPELDDSFVT